MRTKQQLKAYAGELQAEIEKATAAYEAGRLDKNRYKGIVARINGEADDIQSEMTAHRRATKFMADGEAAMEGLPPGPTSGFLGTSMKSINGTPVYPWASTGQSPMQLTDTQSKALIQAALNKTPIRIEVGKKGMESAWMGDVQTKAASSEGALNTNLPPIMMPTRAMGLPYEPSRIMGYLPGAMMTGPSAAWIQHTANTNEAGGVGEGQTKPDLGAQFHEYIAYPQKIAGLATVTLEYSMDYPEMGNLLQTELQRSVINQESLFLLQGNYSGGPTSVFNGLLAQSGTISRAVATNEFVLDTLNKAFVDLRIGPAFCEPDLLILHPTTWASLRRLRDDNGRYILDMLRGPASLTWDGQPGVRTADDTEPYGVSPQGVASTPYGALWGVPVVETTQCPAGTGIVLSIRAGAAVGWTRMGMIVEYDPYAGAAGLNFAQNLYTWRCEERISLTCPRPQAVNIVTGLPTS